jgi:hypothetical protein
VARRCSAGRTTTVMSWYGGAGLANLGQRRLLLPLRLWPPLLNSSGGGGGRKIEPGSRVRRVAANGGFIGRLVGHQGLWCGPDIGDPRHPCRGRKARIVRPLRRGLWCGRKQPVRARVGGRQQRAHGRQVTRAGRWRRRERWKSRAKAGQNKAGGVARKEKGK